MVQVQPWVWPIVAVVISLAALLYGRFDARARRGKETAGEREQQIRDQAKLETKVDTLITTTDQMNKTMTSTMASIEAKHAQTCENMNAQAINIARVEEIAKSAHKRLDEHIKGGV